MSAAPLISVIVPVYNGEKYIATCLQMLQKQTYKALEIIVVDDGSIDASARIADEYQVKVVRFPKNEGLSAARNAGIDIATGKYIHFMDVDDSVNDIFYEQLVHAAENTGADVACACMLHMGRYYKSVLFRKQKVYTGHYEILKGAQVGTTGYVWRYLFEAGMIRNNNLRFEEGRIMEDTIFSIAALYAAKKLVVVPGAKYTYHYNENSILTKKDEEHRKKMRIDIKHSHIVSHEFARRHNISIPGLNSSMTKIRLIKFYRKWGYRLFGKSFIKS